MFPNVRQGQEVLGSLGGQTDKSVRMEGDYTLVSGLGLRKAPS